jgi:hypothetical protein
MRHSGVRHLGRFVSFGSIAVAAAGVVNGCGNYDDRVGSTVAPGATTATTSEGNTPTSSAPATSAPATTAPASTTPESTSTVAATSSVEETSSEPATPPPEAVCEAVTACGGDVVGTWTATSSCLKVEGNVDMSGFGLGCTESPTSGELAVTGSWTFTADGMVTDETMTTGGQTIELQAACLTVSGTVTACDRVGGAMTTIGFKSATCTDDAATGGCTCPAEAAQTGGAGSLAMRSIKAGTYTVADNVLSIKDNRNNLNEYSYCIQGGNMVATLKSLPKAGPVAGQIVFQRQ